MKKLYNILLLLTFIVIISCKKEYIEPNQFSDISWYSSQFQNASYYLALNDYVSFSDLSQGTTSHKWQLLDDGCYFMAGDMTLRDSIYDQYLIDGAGKESAEKTIHVLFKEPGLKRIRLYNEFTDSVAFVGAYGTASATRKGDEWVFDTSFVVDVYDTITPEFKVFDVNDNQIELVDDPDTNNWIVHQIEAGEFVKFVDISTLGRPDSRVWHFENNITNTDSVVTKYYYSLGKFSASITAKRLEPNKPGGSKWKRVPLIIEVLPSTKPFKLVSADETEDEVIQLQLSGNIDETSISGQESFFTVYVTNAESGFSGTIDVESMEVNSTMASILDLHLAEPIYNTDNIVVSYSGGSIRSINDREERDLVDTANIAVAMFGNFNLIGEDYNFEYGPSAGLWYIGSDDTGLGTQEYSMTDPDEGVYCYHMEVTEDNNRTSAVYPELFRMTNGAQYKLKYKAKLVSSGGAGGYEFRINRLGVIEDRYEGNWHGYAALTIGAWVEVEKTFTYTEDDADMGIQMLLYRTAEIYFDDLQLRKYEPRP